MIGKIMDKSVIFIFLLFGGFFVGSGLVTRAIIRFINAKTEVEKEKIRQKNEKKHENSVDNKQADDIYKLIVKDKKYK